MTTTADGNEQVVVTPEIDGGDHISHVGALGDEGRPFVDHPVVDLPGLVVAGVVRLDERTAHGGGQSGGRLCRRGRR
jgi:hypothetical protein